MKKNGQYVGVDEKYIPEEEKYVDESIIGSTDEIKDVIKDGVNKTKEYISNKENQEKIKKAGKKGLKIAKGIGIGYLVFIVIGIVLFLVIFIVAFSMIFKIGNNMNQTMDDTINENSNEINEVYSDFDKELFNNGLEMYSGTEYGTSVKSLLDNIVTSNKTEKDHIITVVYNDTTTSDTDEIVALKSSFEDFDTYEVLLDYDINGFINKVTIETIK